VWLQRQVERLGGTIYRARLAYWSDILRVVPPTNYNLTRVVVNCSGNGARTLGGVQDLDCHPTRGQTVLVRRPGFRKALTLAGG
jgi:D-amino-acid oxidase